ncbi:lipopolysaccharide modification acyltransferase [Alteromonas stellipolaris]|uniref:acyltransferase family protein n=1 Tax=Alteromonas stellipolaris TaxID=233316 RepID=UPI00077051F2|nr:acyltransferase family protein [Alteromonas stellipolaris]AMJ94142.1 lipopolysaccharide modification acyltransferase [Alteromonas stellipolaris]
MNKSKFRADIQGLRALAVLSVVIYHISPFHLPGGFIGVDVFFVISGYLIIGQIYKKVLDNRFEFKEFYVKRFKRLFPAYFVTIAISSIFAFIYFLPGEFQNYTWSLVSSCLYVSNFYFYTKSGYFDSELQGSPLLHTWSLSVEEQFYAIVPILLVACYKFFHKKSILALILVGVVSFILCIYLSNTNISFAFFSSITRFWQFILGGLVSIYTLQLTKQKAIPEIVSIASLITLIACCFFMSHDDFPGFKALIPTLATTLLLAFSNRTLLTYKLLAIKPAKFFGDISYSLYLWHWPVIIFYSLHFERELTAIDKIAVFGISIILGVVSYYFIEERFRRSTNSKSNTFLRVAVLSSAVCAASFAFTQVNDFRFTEQQRNYEQFMLNYKADNFRPGICFLTKQQPDISYYKKDLCIAQSDSKENIVLLGDSHAAHWYSAIKEAINNETQTLTQITASGCKPTLDYKGEARCTELMKWAFSDVLYSESYDKVIISARWDLNDLKPLLETIKNLESRGLTIVVLGPILEYSQPLPRLLAQPNSKEKIMNSSMYDSIAKIDSKFSNALTIEGVEYFSILKTICTDKSKCITVSQNSPIQFDYGHLTTKGAELVLFKSGIASNLNDE